MSKAKKIAAIRTELNSGDDARIIKGLQEMKEHGDPTLIPDLVELLNNQPSIDVESKVLEVLNTLKDNKAVEPLLEAAQLADNKALQPQLMGAIWQSGLSVKGQLDPIVSTALKGDYITAFECLTIIDHAEAIGSRAEIEHQLQQIATYIEQKPNAENIPVIHSLYDALQQQLIN